MDSKIPESLLDLQDALLSAQLRAVRQLKARKTKKQRPKKSQSMSNIDMSIDILPCISLKLLRKSRPPMEWIWIGNLW